MRTTRRRLLAGGVALAAAHLPTIGGARGPARPRIPERRMSINPALGDGVTDCTEAFRAAIASLARRGGGHLDVPPGRYLTGAIHLDNHIDLHLHGGATIAFSTDPAAYLPAVYTRCGGIEIYSYSPFVYAFEKHDVAVTGAGTLDGQAGNQYWWPWAGKTQFGWLPGMPTGDADGARMAQEADAGVPVDERIFGAGTYVRPQFLQPYRCERVLISGITLRNTPNWQMNPVLCTDVTIENVTADSLGPNNDGCDPESCDRVVIRGCTFRTGDDCIAIKAGKNADGRRVNTPCQNILIENCTFLAGHGAITIGSEMSGGVRNVLARDCVATSQSLNDLLRLKTNSARGGFIEHIRVDNVRVDTLADSGVLIDFSYGEGAGHGFDPVVGDIMVRNLTVGSTVYPVYAVGYPEDHIDGLTLAHCRFGTAAKDSVVQYCDDVTITEVTVGGVPL
jgi:polygalacturonase